MVVHEAIDVTAELLYKSGSQIPSVDRNTFKELLEFVSTKALFSTESVHFRQANGAAMRSPDELLLS